MVDAERPFAVGMTSKPRPEEVLEATNAVARSELTEVVVER